MTWKYTPVLIVYHFKCVTNRQEEPTDGTDRLTPDPLGLIYFLLYLANDTGFN